MPIEGVTFGKCWGSQDWNTYKHLLQFTLGHLHYCLKRPTTLVTRVGKKSFYTHFAPPHAYAMLTKHFHLTLVCILPFSNIERGNGGVDTYSVDITNFPTQFVQDCSSFETITKTRVNCENLLVGISILAAWKFSKSHLGLYSAHPFNWLFGFLSARMVLVFFCWFKEKLDVKYPWKGCRVSSRPFFVQFL